jgi:hypothetical protein
MTWCRPLSVACLRRDATTVVVIGRHDAARLHILTEAALSIELFAQLIDDFPQIAGVFVNDTPGQIGARRARPFRRSASWPDGYLQSEGQS